MVADPYGVAQVVGFCRNKYAELGGDRREWWAKFLIWLAAEMAGDPEVECEIDIPLLLNLAAMPLFRREVVNE